MFKYFLGGTILPQHVCQGDADPKLAPYPAHRGHAVAGEVSVENGVIRCCKHGPERDSAWELRRNRSCRQSTRRAGKSADRRHGFLLSRTAPFSRRTQTGISQARNAAVAWAMNKGADFIAFLDDDDVPEPDWLGHMLRRQTATEADIVIGAFRSVFPPDTPQWVMKDPDYASSSLDVSRRFLGRPHGSSTCICLISGPFMRRMGEAG